MRDLTRAVARRTRTHVPGVDRGRVVFLVDSPRDILSRSLLPVLEQVEARGVGTVLLAVESAAAGLGAGGRQVVVLRRPARLGSGRDRRRTFDDVRATFPEYLDADDRPVFERVVRSVGELLAESTRVLERLRPRCVVLSRDQPVPAAPVAVAARALGIPSLALQHGMVGGFDVPLVADTYATWGDVSCAQLAAAGADPRRLVVVGSPRHDRPAGLDQAVVHRLRQALGLDHRLVFTFFSGAHATRLSGTAPPSGCASWLGRVAADLGEDVAILVRLHPDEDGRLYSGMDGIRVLDRSLDLPTVFAVSDAVGSMCSTTLMEAHLYGKPALQFLADDWPELTDFWRRGLTVRVASGDDLVGRLRELGQPDRYREAAADVTARTDQVFANVGHAAHAVADQVLHLAGETPDRRPRRLR